MFRYLLLVSFVVLLPCVPPALADDIAEKYRSAATKQWSEEMQRIAKLDATEQDPENAILFLGSSSIRLWKDIAADMQPWPVISRGYGGAKFSDLAVLAPQIVRPHRFRAAVIFVANDVTGGQDDKSPEEVVKLFEHVVGSVRAQNPQAPIFLVEITPTPKRWAVWDKIQQVNAQLKAACQRGEQLHFISTADKYLDAQGQPMPELFIDDKLHQNRDGYARWSKLIADALNAKLK
jgi:lysophospholipase L1-like esterase